MNSLVATTQRNRKVIDDFKRLRLDTAQTNPSSIDTQIGFLKNHIGVLDQSGDTISKDAKINEIFFNHETLSRHLNSIKTYEVMINFLKEDLNEKITAKEAEIRETQLRYNEAHAKFESYKDHASRPTKKARQSAKAQFLKYQKESNQIRDELRPMEKGCDQLKLELQTKTTELASVRREIE